MSLKKIPVKKDGSSDEVVIGAGVDGVCPLVSAGGSAAEQAKDMTMDPPARTSERRAYDGGSCGCGVGEERIVRQLRKPKSSTMLAAWGDREPLGIGLEKCWRKWTGLLGAVTASRGLKRCKLEGANAVIAGKSRRRAVLTGQSQGVGGLSHGSTGLSFDCGDR